MAEKPEKKLRKFAKSEIDDKNLDDDLLPETGLYTPEGDLFYHSSPVQLTKSQFERVAKHGINLKSKKAFTIEESVQIFKNWKEFAEENGMKLSKAAEYIGAKKKDKHLIKHQEEHRFWPKLCKGLPYRHCRGIKARAESMLTDDFLSTLNWEDPAPQIQEKFYEKEERDDLTMGKARLLLDKGYSVTHMAEILDLSQGKSKGIAQNLKAMETRDDPAMVKMVFETATTFGFNVEKIKNLLISSDEDRFFRKSLKNVKFEALSLKLHMSEQRCKEFLKEEILKKIWEEFQKIMKKNEEEFEKEDVAEQVLVKITAEKPALTAAQKLKALEIFCKFCQKSDSCRDLGNNLKLSAQFRAHGIKNFQCRMAEDQHLHTEICQKMTRLLDEEIFQNLRRKFRFQLKIHLVLWSLKKLTVWSKIPVKAEESKFEAVLKHELENPLASDFTKKFLKSRNVARWIMDPLPRNAAQAERTSRKETGAEAFFLWTLQKFNGYFNFPAKLDHLISKKSSPSVYRLLQKRKSLSEDPEDNSEYLTSKEVRETVEKASNSKIAVKLKTKEIFAKVEDSEDTTEHETEDEDDVKELMRWSRKFEKEWVETTKKQVEEVLEKADPAKRKKAYRLMDSEGTDQAIVLAEEIRRRKRVLDRAVRLQNTETNRVKSKEFLSSSEDSSDDDEKKKEEDSEGSEGPSAWNLGDEDEEVGEDVGETERKGRKRQRKDSEIDGDDENLEAPEYSEDVTESRRRKRKRKIAFDDEENVKIQEDSEAPKDPEDVPKPSEAHHRKKKKSKPSECSEGPEDVLEPSTSKKKKKKSRKDKELEDVLPEGSEDPEPLELRNGGEMEDSEDSGSSEDVPKREKTKKRKSRRDEELEDVTEDFEVPEDVENPEEVPKRKKNKSRKVDESEDVPGDSKFQELRGLPDDEVENPEDVESSEDISKKKKSKKKKSRRDEVPEDSGNPYDRKLRNDKNMENPEDVLKSKKNKKK